MLCGRRALGVVEFFSICTCGGDAQVTRPASPWVMADRAHGGAFGLAEAASDAGALDGFKEKRVSRALRLLFITDATGTRFGCPTATSLYLSWFVILQTESAVWLVR